MQIHDNQGNIIDDLNPLPTKEVDSTIVKPVKIDSHTATTIQTHNAVSVALSGNSVQASWIDLDGFDKLALTFLNDASTSSTVDLWWSNDGVTLHGVDTAVIPNGTAQQRTGVSDIKARYVKVRLWNNDAGLAHTMSAWAMLRA